MLSPRPAWPLACSRSRSFQRRQRMLRTKTMCAVIGLAVSLAAGNAVAQEPQKDEMPQKQPPQQQPQDGQKPEGMKPEGMQEPKGAMVSKKMSLTATVEKIDMKQRKVTLK